MRGLLLQPQRRAHARNIPPTQTPAPPTGEGFRPGPRDTARPQRQGADHLLCAGVERAAQAAAPAQRPDNPHLHGGAGNAGVGLHNSKDGRCFPSFDAIAAKAGCHRDTVNEAIKALEFAGILTWVNRIARIRPELDLFGRWVNRARIIRTSNSYLFRDPLPCAEVPEGRGSSKSENPSGTLNPDLSLSLAPCPTAKLDPDNPLERALIGLGRALGALPAQPAI